MLETAPARIVIALAVAVVAHFATVLIRGGVRRLLRSHMRSEAKLLTVTGFAASLIVFAIYFAAVGFLLSELGISLTTYLASASVIGLAVSFGSQGVVQDVITGLTVVLTDLVDVGDMVDIGGQVGIVENVGMRFTALINFAGARVYVPNRSIGNVISYPKGYIRAFVDARLPADPTLRDEAERRLSEAARAAHEQFPGILLLPPAVEGRHETVAAFSYLRIKFRIWPGQGAVLETAVRASMIQALRGLDDKYADWMVTVHYRSEPAGDAPERRLPRPAALLARERAASRKS